MDEGLPTVRRGHRLTAWEAGAHGPLAPVYGRDGEENKRCRHGIEGVGYICYRG